MYKEYNPVLILKNYNENEILSVICKERFYLKNKEVFCGRFFRNKEVLDKIKLGYPIFLFYLCEEKIHECIEYILVGNKYDFGLWKTAWQAMAIEQFKKYPQKKFIINTNNVEGIKVPLPKNVIITLK